MLVPMNREREMRRLLSEREREGLTYRELSERCGVPAGTLASWAFKLRRMAEPAIEFVELKAAEQPVSRGRVEIVTRTDRRLLVDIDADPNHVARLVAALERC